MGFLNLFRQKHPEDNPQVCMRLSESDECSTVTKIRALQEQLDNVEDKIKKLSSTEYTDIQEVIKFFNNDNLYSIYYSSHRINMTYGDIERICFAISDIENIDKFLEEVKNIHNREMLISEARGEAIAIKDAISAAKKELGIR